MTESGWTLHSDADLRTRNSLALPARARWLAEIHHPDALTTLLQQPRLRGLQRRVLGGGSNLVLPHELDALVLHPRFASLTSAESGGDTLELFCDAGMDWHALVQWTVSGGWRGIENLALIPGQVGAAPIQNIGAYGVEIGDALQWVEWLELDSGRLIRMPTAQLQLGYRDSRFKQLDAGSFLIIRLCLRLHRNTMLKLDYSGIGDELERLLVTDPGVADVFDAVCALRRRKLPDPAIQPNAGSFFKNPLVTSPQARALLAAHPAMPNWPQADGSHKLSAAWLIEQCGFKGAVHGNAAVAQQHALVLVNPGQARGSDILALATRIQTTVQERFGVTLQIEPQVW